MARPKKNPTGEAGEAGEAGTTQKTTGSSGNRRTARPMTLQRRVATLVQSSYSKKLNRLADQIRQIARGG